jgi:hypothetical protein
MADAYVDLCDDASKRFQMQGLCNPIKFQRVLMRHFTAERNKNSSCVVITNVVPDASASAAGVRTMALLDRFSKKFGMVHLTVPSSHITSESQIGKIAQVSSLPPNRSDLFKTFCQQFTSSPRNVLFDRFYVEEAFSHGFHAEFPGVPLVLDMQDMHSLRQGRQTLVKHFDAKYSKQGEDPLVCLTDVVNYIPSTSNDDLIRELSSIHRCDLTLVCSPYELHLLKTEFQIPAHKLSLASFFMDTANLSDLCIHNKKFNASTRFVFCGGFKHAPNVDAVRMLLRHIWPILRTSLPTATLHIHGAYCTKEFYQQHAPNEKGVYIHGYTPCLDDIFMPGSILLAPLRFGAGIKGKILDAWSFGLPVVTTPIGREGIVTSGNEKDFGGAIASTTSSFCDHAIQLATDPETYFNAQGQGQHLLKTLFDSDTNWKGLEARLDQTHINLLDYRQSDYHRAMLWHHSRRSVEYFSKWIELKEGIKK